MPTILQLIVVLFDVCITVSYCSYFHHMLCLHLFAHPTIHPLLFIQGRVAECLEPIWAAIGREAWFLGPRISFIQLV